MPRLPTEMDTGHDNNLLPFSYVSQLKFCCVNERIFFNSEFVAVLSYLSYQHEILNSEILYTTPPPLKLKCNKESNIKCFCEYME